MRQNYKLRTKKSKKNPSPKEFRLTSVSDKNYTTWRTVKVSRMKKSDVQSTTQRLLKPKSK